MPKIRIDHDDWQVYDTGYRGPEVDVPQETLDAWQRVFDEFWAMQEEMQEWAEGKHGDA